MVKSRMFEQYDFDRNGRMFGMLIIPFFLFGVIGRMVPYNDRKVQTTMSDELTDMESRIPVLKSLTSGNGATVPGGGKIPSPYDSIRK